MPQLQDIVLTDRASTPVNHTFVPRDIDASGVGMVVSTNGVPVGEKRLAVGMAKKTSRYRGVVKLALPVVQTETVNGISRPKVVRTAYANCEFVFDETSSEQERNDCVGMLASALASSKTLVNDAIVKVQGVY